MTDEEIMEMFPDQFYCPLCDEWVGKSAIIFHQEQHHPIELPNGERLAITWKSFYERMKSIGYI